MFENVPLPIDLHDYYISQKLQCSKISNFQGGGGGLSRDQQQQDPPEQPEQLPEEAEQGRGDGGEGHLDQEGQVDQDHLGRCQPPLISVAATLCLHHHCFLPAK